MPEPTYFVALKLIDIAPWLFGGVQGTYVASTEYPDPAEILEEMHESVWSWLALIAVVLSSCSVPTTSVVPDAPKKPSVTQTEADAQARRALTHLAIGKQLDAHKLLRAWSMKTKCWTGMSFAYFRSAKIERKAFSNLEIPERMDVVSHLTAPLKILDGGVVGLITAVDCDRKPTYAA